MEDLAPTSGSAGLRDVGHRRRGGAGAARQLHGRRPGVASFTSRQGPTDDPGVVVAVSREPAAGATTPTIVVSAGAGDEPRLGGVSRRLVSSEPRPSARAPAPAPPAPRRRSPRRRSRRPGSGRRPPTPRRAARRSRAARRCRRGRAARRSPGRPGRDEDELVAAEAATVSTSRTAPASTDATRRRTSSPTSWPAAAFVAAKSSTSKIATETSPPWRPARASSSSRTRANVRWLARPVSGSVWAMRSNHSDRSATVEASRDRSTATAPGRPSPAGTRRRHQRARPARASRTSDRAAALLDPAATDDQRVGDAVARRRPRPDRGGRRSSGWSAVATPSARAA